MSIISSYLGVPESGAWGKSTALDPRTGLPQVLTEMSHFDEIGGEPALRAIVEDFVDRCFDDTMIGFLFQRAERDRIKRFEYQHAAEHLGGSVVYEGRPLDEAHRPHRIFGGQFARRRQILIETLRDHEVPGAVVEAWIAHQDGLRALVTKDADSNCQG